MITASEKAKLKRLGYGDAVIDLNADTLRELIGTVGAAPAKYRNIPASGPGGRIFQSGHEAGRAGELELLQTAGQICCLTYQVPFDISPAGHTGRPIHYIADFVYISLPDFRPVVEDAKVDATRTAVYRLKKKYFEAKYAPMKITEV